MNKSAKVLLLVALTFALYFIVDDLYFKELRKQFFDLTNQYGLSHIAAYFITGIPLLLGTLILGKGKKLGHNLGLDQSISAGFLFALVCTLPMFIGFSLFFDFNQQIKLNTLIISVIAAGFFEELYFRGFLFGLPFRKTKLGFLPAVFFGAVYFGVLHLYQSNQLGELIGIFLITFLGGILFAWVFAEWNFNIWAPIFLHLFMNLAWELFSISDTALGGVYANIFRFLTVSLVVVITILYKKRNKLPFVVTRQTLWFRREAEAGSTVKENLPKNQVRQLVE